MDNTLDRRTAERRVRAKLGFVAHATTYVVVMSALAAINLITDRSQLWFVWPLLGWGIGLAFHAAAALLLPKGTHAYDRMVDRELRPRA